MDNQYHFTKSLLQTSDSRRIVNKERSTESVKTGQGAQELQEFDRAPLVHPHHGVE